MIVKLQMPFMFDVAKLQEELFVFSEKDWIPHFNKGVYDGNWSAIPLRSVEGNAKDIFPDPTGLKEYGDTEHLMNSPYTRSVVDSFLCDKTAIRWMRLKAGSVIKEHRDYDLAPEDGEVRIHIPVTTNPGVEFFVNREKVILKEGECWYLNFNLPHSVANTGSTDRVHIVMDCKVNDWVKQLFGL